MTTRKKESESSKESDLQPNRLSQPDLLASLAADEKRIKGVLVKKARERERILARSRALARNHVLRG
jgi:hypothetical protein